MIGKTDSNIPPNIITKVDSDCFTTFDSSSNSSFGKHKFTNTPAKESSNEKINGTTKIIKKFTKLSGTKIAKIIAPKITAGDVKITCKSALAKNSKFSFIGLDFSIQKFFPSSDTVEPLITPLDSENIKTTHIIPTSSC